MTARFRLTLCALLWMALFCALAARPARAVTKTWNNAAGGIWSTGANWTPAGAPTKSDDVVITLAGIYTVTLDVSTTVRSLKLGGASGTQSLSINGQTLDLTNASTINAHGVLDFISGTLFDNGGLTVSGIINWSSGIVTGAGTTTIAATGRLNIPGSGVAPTLDAHTLANSGTLLWTGGNIQLASNAIIRNQAGGLFDVRTSNTVIFTTGTAATINNAGTLRQSNSSGGTTTIGNANLSLINSGTLDVQDGVLQLAGGGNHTFKTGTLLTGAGVTSLVGTLTLAGTVQATTGTLELTSGTLTGTGTLSGAGTYNWLSTTILNANITVANGSTLRLPGSGGSAPLLDASTLNIANGGTLLRTGGNIQLSNNAVINTRAGGLFDVRSFNTVIFTTGSAATINNAGTLRQSSSGGTTTIGTQVAFNNTGTLEVQSGILQLAGSGNHTFKTGTLLTGAGVTSLVGTLTLAGTVQATTGTLELTSGTLTGTGTLSGAGTYNWLSTTILNANITVANGSTLRLPGSGGSAPLLDASTLNIANGGTLLRTGGNIQLSNNAVINTRAGGLFDVRSFNTVIFTTGSAATINNAGTLRQSSSGGTTTIGTQVAFNNTGTLEVQSGTLRFDGSYTQTAGTTTLMGTTLSTGGTINLLGGTLNGTGAVIGNLNNAATVAPGLSPGCITVAGNYTQSGALDIQIGGLTPCTQHDQLTVNSATLGGALNVSFVGFTSTLGNVFTILVDNDSDAIGGTFAGLAEGAAVRVGSRLLRLSYSGGDGNDVTLTDIGLAGSATDVSWINAAGGNWNVPVNWRDGTGVNRVPTASDNAFITLAGTYTVALNVDATVRSLTLGGSSGTQTLTTGGHALILNQASTVNGNGVLDMSSGELNNSVLLTVKGTFNWSGGFLKGTLNVATSGTFNSVFGGILDGGTINNSGTFNWTSQPIGNNGRIEGRNGAIFNNQTGGIFNAQTDGTVLSTNGTAATFNNLAGATFAKIGGSFEALISSWTFNDSGTINAVSGNLGFRGVANFNNGATFTGGQTQLHGAGGTANYTISGTATIGNGASILFEGDTLTGGTGSGTSGTIKTAGSGSFNWSGGFLKGTLNIAAGSTFNSVFGGILDGGTINNSGTFNWTSQPIGNNGRIEGRNGAVFNNQAGGIFNAQTDGTILSTNGTAATFNNLAGATFAKIGGTGTSGVASWAFNNRGTVESRAGVLNLGSAYSQAAGRLDLNGGDLAGTLNIQGGSLIGAGTITGSVANGGALSPGHSPACVTVNGNYGQSGAFNVEIGGLAPCTQHDRLAVNGPVSLGGALNLSLINGFVPAPGNSFTLLLNDGADAITGTFAGLPEGAVVTLGGQQLRLSYHGGDGNDVTLVTLVAIVPNLVTNTANSGAGSLRAAINFANANPGTTIRFNIPTSDPGFSGGVFTIKPASALPSVTAAGTVIDGATQTAFGGNTNPGGPEIALDGSATGAGPDGLTLRAANGVVRRLVINRFSNAGVLISGAAATGNTVQGCLLGTNADGTSAAGNLHGVAVTTGAANNTIGGTTVAARNVISGNTDAGLVLSDAGTKANQVQGNFIGTNAAGTAAIPNNDGVSIVNGGQNNVIGSAGAGNVIAGNSNGGVLISGAGTGRNRVQSNIIGLNAAGTAAIANGDGMILLGAGNNLIGGAAVARNIISGNTRRGVLISGMGAILNQLHNNYIGTNAAGTVALGNNDGVAIVNGAADNEVGFGNLGNLISGNRANGVALVASGGNAVLANRIGTDAAGTGSLPNRLNGVSVQRSTFTGTRVVARITGNTIAFNGRDGINIGSGTTGCLMFTNAIHHNVRLGINLDANNDPNGVTPNDPNDTDSGPNNLQNFPIITDVRFAGGITTLTATLNSTPNQEFQVEFYRNTAADPSGNGEGQASLGVAVATTNAAGNATFTLAKTGALTGVFSATALNRMTGDTSEFGPAFTPSLTLTVAPTSISEGAGAGAATGTVTRPAAGAALVVTLSSSDAGEATVPASVTIALGATSATFPIAAVNDPSLDGPQTVTITASAAGSSDTATLTVTDNEIAVPGALFAWGYNDFGQIGDGTTTDRLTPFLVPGLSNMKALATGAGSHTVAVKGNGTVVAWGYNGAGQVGDGTTTDRRTPVAVSGLTTVQTVAAGWYHTLALKDDGTVWAWGHNKFGQVGDGTTTNRLVPVRVAGLSHIKAIAGGIYFSLALQDDGTVWAWGSNFYGQLGDGTTNDHATPVRVAGLRATAIAAGGAHSVAVLADGSVRAWGWNENGQLGDNSTTDRHAPVLVQGLSASDIDAVAAGYAHTLARQSGGALAWAWGNNTYGQIGDDTTTQRLLPVPVPGLTTIAALAAGGTHSLALKTDGTLTAWGFNTFGQLGNGATVDRHKPSAVPGLTGVTDIAAAYGHSLAIGPGVIPR